MSCNICLNRMAITLNQESEEEWNKRGENRGSTCVIDTPNAFRDKNIQPLMARTKANDRSKKLPLIVGGFLNITQRCNLKCKYCFVVQQPKDMSYQVAKDAVDFYAKNAKETGEIPNINYFGGEPLLMWDEIIVPLTEYIRETYGNRYQVSMTTNGILLDKEKLEFMKKHQVGFLFSIDGDKKTQDLNRPFHNGKGSFDLLIDKIPMFLEYNPEATFRSTIDHDNVNDVFHNFKFALDNGYANVFGLVNVFEEWKKEEEDILKDQVRQIADLYMDYIREGKEISYNPINEMFSEIKKANRAEENGEFRDQGINFPGFGRCGIGASKFGSIGPSGDVFSCQELVENPKFGDTFTIGNIYTEIDEEKRWEIIEKFDPRNVIRSDGQSCLGCRLNKVCHGHCLINNYLANGDLNIMPAILCSWYQMLFEEALRIMKIMSEEKNETFKEIFNRA